MKLALSAVLIAAVVLPATPASASILAATTGAPVASQFSLQGASLGSVLANAALTDVAYGDVNGDGTDDLVLAGAQQLSVRDGKTGAVLRTIALGRGVGAGSVDAGDVTGDGRADLVLAAGGSVRVYDGKTGAVVRSFLPYASGDAAVSVGDLEGDGRAEIATAAGPHVKVFAADGTLLRSFLAYAPGTAPHTDVAVGDADGDGHADLVTVAGPHVRVFAGATVVRSFFAGEPTSQAAASVAVSGGRVVIAAGSTVRVVNGATLATEALFLPFGLTSGPLAIAA